MPRSSREKSESGIYHIMLRGINRQEIFHDEEDKVRFLETFDRYKKQCSIKLLGWCLMGNHVHLLVGEGNEPVSNTIKRIGVSFAWYYNWKYKHVGHLFQDRYKSESIKDDSQLLTALRYIHQNPVKAGIVRNCGDWKWSSCGAYYGKNEYPVGLTDTELVKGMMSEAQFREFNEQLNEDCFLDDAAAKRLTDDEAREEISRILGKISISELQGMPKSHRDEILKRVKGIEAVSQRQAARILGISENLIFKA
jgi:REP element-mobilizing transposase RayT